MNVYASGLGYREVGRLANFMKWVFENGLHNDVPVTFAYDSRNDKPYCTTENGDIITINEEHVNTER